MNFNIEAKSDKKKFREGGEVGGGGGGGGGAGH